MFHFISLFLIRNIDGAVIYFLDTHESDTNTAIISLKYTLINNN